MTMPDPQLWSPANPALYHADVYLISGNKSINGLKHAHGRADAQAQAHAHEHIRFGLREMAIDGQYFILNGNRHFLVGTGDDFAYSTEAPPMNKSVYLSRLRLMKEYGFDFIRLHSHFEAPGFFEAADEVGFFISPALPMGGCKEVLERTWEWQINALRNTPSVMDVCMSNEAYGEPPMSAAAAAAAAAARSMPEPTKSHLHQHRGHHRHHHSKVPVGGWPGALFPWKDEFYQKAKALNPTLHVIDTDGCCWAETEPHKSVVQMMVDGPPICPAPYANGTCKSMLFLCLSLLLLLFLCVCFFVFWAVCVICYYSWKFHNPTMFLSAFDATDVVGCYCTAH